MSFASSTSKRFSGANVKTPGPGTYHSQKMVQARLPPEAGRYERSGWLRGAMGTSSNTPRVSREGFVGNQKDGGSPGPGAYSHPSSFTPRGTSSKPTGFSSGASRFHDPKPVSATQYPGHKTWGDARESETVSFHASRTADRTAWLAGEVGGHGAVSGSGGSHVAAQRPAYLESPGPGSYDPRTRAPPSPRMAQERRFVAAGGNPNVGPGSYHNWAPMPAQASPASTEVMRDSWLKGAAGGRQSVSGSRSQHVDRQHLLESPGPGAYEYQSSFSRAMVPNHHQVGLEQRGAL